MYHQQPNGGGSGGAGASGGVSGRAGGSTPNGPLEDRLRNLILSNNENDGYFGVSPNSAYTGTPPSSLGFTPGSSAGLDGVDEASPMSATRPGQAPVSPRSARKRPNQAQRRQMSAQLSIPIDPRPVPPHSAGNYVSPPGFGSHQHHFQHPHAQHQQNHFHSQHSYHQQQTTQRPQSATLRPSHYGHGPTSSIGHANGASYPSQPRHHQSLSYQGPSGYDDPYNWRSHQPHQPALSPFDASSPRSARPHNHQSGRLYHAKPEDIQTQASWLERLCEQIVSSAEIEPAEIQEKEQFRARIERISQEALARYEFEENGRMDFPPMSVRLKCFGSLSSGFATKASDMDLGIISPLSLPQPDFPKSPIPRILEKAFLEAGLGARLLSRTRVPIIKLCEKPPKQLQLDLLEERAKWERGLLPEHDGPDAEEDAADEPEASPLHVEDNALDDAKLGHGRKESVLDGDQLDGDKYSQTLAHLKQPANQSIGNYYAAAKRILRKLGGRDITHSTVREFKEKDLKVLTDVCHAFVDGLADAELKRRLFATRSLTTSATPSALNYRSLYGVLMQVEGERLAMLWDARETHEKDMHQEEEAMDKIRAWKELQDKPGFAIDLLGYNKELQVAVDGLKKIVSLQVMTLEQGQFESPTQYHDRATKLLFHSGGRDTASTSPENPALPIVIQHYVAGIWNHDIRAQVDSFAQSIDKSSLRAIARRHKSLQLALEFERALAKNCYDDSSASDVQAYIEVLRLPLQKCDLPGRRFDYVVPRTPETAAVISRARQLTDPSKLSPNQPRDPYRDRLEFPKTGTGVQCDINFSAHLGLQNTLLLRCYSHTDARVRPLVLFVKHWAKMRGINTPYRGTLSSYGYVLMMLHYLVNVAQPFVCPNLQQLAKPVPEGLSPEELEETVSCRGRDVRFWRDEEEIKNLASKGLLNQNNDSIGHLLRGFFEYYAQSNFMSTVPCRGFDWGRDVLSLRTQGGLRSKQEKGWTGARTVLEVQNQATAPPALEKPAVSTPFPPADGLAHVDGAAERAQPSPGVKEAATVTTPGKSSAATKLVELKEVKHRYLFAIEDPFELEHNVARTVTHSGIVAIRDEFRRAWRIIKQLGKFPDENLLEDVTDSKGKERDLFAELLNEIHGPELSLH